MMKEFPISSGDETRNVMSARRRRRRRVFKLNFRPVLSLKIIHVDFDVSLFVYSIEKCLFARFVKIKQHNINLNSQLAWLPASFLPFPLQPSPSAARNS